MLNFLWTTLHDFIYIGVAAVLYWFYHQPPEVRNNAMIVGAVLIAWLAGEVVNFRWHRQMDKRLRELEKRLKGGEKDD